MNGYIVCEGQVDAAVIAELLRPWSSSRSVKIVTGDGRSPSIALARTIASSTDAAVALALDSDTTDQERAKSIQTDLLSLLGRASGGLPHEVVLFVPEVECVFFQSAPDLARGLGLPGIKKTVLLSAKYEPKAQLVALMKSAGMNTSVGDFVTLTKRVGIKPLRGHVAIQQLVRFLQSSLSDLPQLQLA